MDWSGVALVVAAVMVFAFAGWVTFRPAEPPANTSSTLRPPSETPTAEPDLAVDDVPLADALARLDEPGRPFTVSIIGDSTGASGEGWQVELGRWISTEYDRPVTLHPWAVETNPHAYGPTWDLGDGANAPVTIWNGSASGRDITYSDDRLDELIPRKVTPDLIVFNHGHNLAAGEWASQAPRFLEHLAQTYPSAAFLVMVQNPEVAPSPKVEAQVVNVADARAYTQDAGVAAVDVWAAFKRAGSVAEMTDRTGFHPTPDGYQVWADALLGTLTAG